MLQRAPATAPHTGGCASSRVPRCIYVYEVYIGVPKCTQVYISVQQPLHMPVAALVAVYLGAHNRAFREPPQA